MLRSVRSVLARPRLCISVHGLRAAQGLADCRHATWSPGDSGPRTTTADSSGKTSLVIFDKDGTLICFQSMWSPWARQLASRLEQVSGQTISDKVFRLLGYCDKSSKVQPGLLAESTMPIIKDELAKLLISEGIATDSVRKIITHTWEEGYTSGHQSLRPLADLKTLFKILGNNGIKIAICTSDTRKGTLNAVKQLGIDQRVDMIVCGDDAATQPKPSAHNAHMICRVMGVDPSEAAMVGDTQADVGMGRAANLGKSIGVLSGVGRSEDLSQDATHIVESVRDILPLVLPSQVWKDYCTDPSLLPDTEQTTAADKSNSLGDENERLGSYV